MNLTKDRGQSMAGIHSFVPMATTWLASGTDDDDDITYHCWLYDSCNTLQQQQK